MQNRASNLASDELRFNAWSLCITLLASLAMIAGCSSRSTKRTVVVIPRLGVDARWLSLHVGLGEAADADKVKLYWNGPSIRGDVQSQIDLANRAVDIKAFGIVVEPNSYVALNGIVRRALSAGIPTVVLGESAGFAPAPHLSFVLRDDAEAGRLIAMRLNRLLQGHGDVLVSGLFADLPGNVERSDQIQAQMSRICPGIHVVDKIPGRFSTGLSRTLVQAAIHAHPQVKAIVALSAVDAGTAMNAVHFLGLDGQIAVIALDQNLGMFRSLRAGNLDSMVVDDFRGMGRRAVENVVADREGRGYSQVTVLKPVMVTREELDTESVQQLLLMHRRLK